MRQFDYTSIASAATDPQTAERLARINRVKDLQAFRSGYTKRELDQLRLRTLAEDGRTSCALSGIIVPAPRIRGLVAGDFAPARTDEHEVVGVLRTLNTVEYQYRSTHVSPGVIMLLHKRMLFDVDRAVAGRWRTADDDAAWAADHPVTSPDDLAFEVPAADEVEMLLHNLCTALRQAQRGPRPTDPIVQAAAFFCDFENIHPFAMGTGRMARIMLQLLLLKGGCLIGLYQSIFQAIHRSRADFRTALRASSVGWARGENDYAPIVSYLVGVIDSCYELHGDYELKSADDAFKAQAAQANAADASGDGRAAARSAQAAGAVSGPTGSAAEAAPVVARASHPTHEQSRAAARAGYVPVAQRAAAAESKPAHDQTAAERIEALARERIAAMRQAKERARREEEKRQAEEKRVAEAAAAAAAAARAASPVLSGAFAPMEKAPVASTARRGKNRAGRAQGSSAAGNASASARTASSSSAGASGNPRITRSHAAAAPAEAHNARIRRSEGAPASGAPASSTKRASGVPAARSGAHPSNEQIIRDYFAHTKDEVSKQEILEANPVMSKKTLERILKTLREDGTVEMVGAARSSRYRARR